MAHDPQLNRTIALLGPPHSGKSVFVAELYRQSLADPAIGRTTFLQRTCPDGEGMWSAEADQDLVKEIRRKGEFSPTTINFYLQSVEALKRTKEITYVDCGGLMSMENVLVLGHSTDAIILSSSPVKLEQWQLFCRSLDQITTAIQSRDYDTLLRMQREGYVEVLPAGKMDQFESDEALQAEIARRVEVLHENFGPQLAAIEPHAIEVRAAFKSELLDAGQRAWLDELLIAEQPLPDELVSHIDRSTEPWTGVIRDLDRRRANDPPRGRISYAAAAGEVVEGIVELNRETKAEVEADREDINTSETREGGLK